MAGMVSFMAGLIFYALVFWLPFVGSLFFVASDTILGYHLFRYQGKSKHGDFFAGLTYIPAQQARIGASGICRGRCGGDPREAAEGRWIEDRGNRDCGNSSGGIG